MANTDISTGAEAGEVVYTCHPGHKFPDGTQNRTISCSCANTNWGSIDLNWGQAEPCLGKYPRLARHMF